MIKNITGFICLFIFAVSFAQTSTKSRINEYLNDNESEYLNNLFENEKDNFDFTNKKIGFISGTSGNKKKYKTDYFKFTNSSEQKGSLIIFNEQEKIYSGGYDAVIIYWSKVLQKKKRIIKILKRKY